jgi:heme-degrading monooxygenase HmoA
VVVDLWESEDDFRSIFDAAEFKRNVAASNWPGRPEVEVDQVHATIL